MKTFNIVAIAGSYGGQEALSQILSALPPFFPAPIVIVQHLSPSHPSALVELLNRRTALQVKHPRQDEPLCPGMVYIACPNQHMLVNAAHRLSHNQAEKVNFTRPAADVLFQSVAAHYPYRALGIVLSGMGQDGAQGVRAIKMTGGKIFVQDSVTSPSFGMPSAAIATGCVDFVLPLNKIASALVSFVMVKGVASLFEVSMPHWACLPTV